MRYTIRRDRVTHQTLDGEAVVLNLETGCYYSLVRVGAEVWGLIEAARTPDEVAAALAVRYADCPPTARGDVERLLEQLVSEGLAVRSANGVPAAGAPAEAIPAARATAAYTPPGLERFDDLKDLLLLDPIHDVDAAGWPNAKG